jgi:hypothetical protein
MRKLILAAAVCLLPVVAASTSGSATAAAPGQMTILDRLSTAEANVEQAQYRRRRCYQRTVRVCTKRIFGKCVRHRYRTETYCRPRRDW